MPEGLPPLQRSQKDKHFVPAAVVLAFSLWLSYQALQMPRPTGWPAAPGLFPLFIGITLALMAILLTLEGLRERRNRDRAAEHGLGPGGTASESAWTEEEQTDATPDATIERTRASSARTWVIIGWVACYIFILIRFLPFEFSTSIFLIGSLGYFWRAPWWKVVTVSLGVSFLLSAVFVLMFSTLLPGPSSLLEMWLF